MRDGNLILTQEPKGNSETMINHLQVVRSQYPIDKKLIIFTDNASWHKTKIVEEYSTQNNIELWFTPPYSPEFNPIERVWNFMKSITKKEIFTNAEYFKKYVGKLFDSMMSNYRKQLCGLSCSLI